MNAGAYIALAVAEYAIVDIIVSRQRNALDYGRGDDGYEEKRKSDQKEDGEGGGGFEQHGDLRERSGVVAAIKTSVGNQSRAVMQLVRRPPGEVSNQCSKAGEKKGRS